MTGPALVDLDLPRHALVVDRDEGRWRAACTVCGAASDRQPTLGLALLDLTAVCDA